MLTELGLERGYEDSLVWTGIVCKKIAEGGGGMGRGMRNWEEGVWNLHESFNCIDSSENINTYRI